MTNILEYGIGLFKDRPVKRCWSWAHHWMPAGAVEVCTRCRQLRWRFPF